MTARDQHRTCESGLKVHGCENVEGIRIRTTCYRCGGPVCRACSAIVVERVAGKMLKIRRCNDCAGFYQNPDGTEMSMDNRTPSPPKAARCSS